MERMVSLTVCLLCLSTLFLPQLAADSPSQPNCTSCFAELVEHYRGRGWIGVTFHRHGPGQGLEVLEIAPEGPAATTSLRPGDVVLFLSGQNIREAETSADVEAILASIEPNKAIDVMVERNEDRLTIELRPRPLPRENLVQVLGQHVLRHGESRQYFGPTGEEKPPGS